MPTLNFTGILSAPTAHILTLSCLALSCPPPAARTLGPPNPETPGAHSAAIRTLALPAVQEKWVLLTIVPIGFMISFIALGNEGQGLGSHGCKGGGQELVPAVFPASLPRASGIQVKERGRR